MPRVQLKYVLLEERDVGGTIPRQKFETLDEANLAQIRCTKAEDQRWNLIKRNKPDYPREGMSCFRVEKL